MATLLSSNSTHFYYAITTCRMQLDRQLNDKLLYDFTDLTTIKSKHSQITKPCASTTMEIFVRAPRQIL